MKLTLIRCAFVCVLALQHPPVHHGVALAQAQSASGAPVELTVLAAPLPVKSSGQAQLVYELHITNFYVRDYTLSRLDVFAGENDDAPLASFRGAELTDLLERPGTVGLADKRVIGGGMRAVVYIWLTSNKGERVPGSLRHRLYFSYVNAAGKADEDVIDGARVAVRGGPPLEIGPPLRGTNWMAANGPSNRSIHRRRMLPYNGRVTISQRFAYDFMLLGDDGKAVRGEPSRNENWHGHGAEVLAVGDGTIVDVQDGVPENVPLSPQRAVAMTPQTAGGNYVVLDLGGGHFAFYAHLRPQSVRVKIGDRVRRGQILGLVGNSGGSDAPHLHFHIGDHKSPIEADGLPFVFESFEELGEAKLPAALGLEDVGSSWKADAKVTPINRRREMPLENTVVRFK